MSAELHGTAEDPGYVRERAYDLYGTGVQILTEKDASDLEVELNWEFGPVEVDISDGLRVVFENDCVSMDRKAKLDAFIREFVRKHWGISREPSED